MVKKIFTSFLFAFLFSVGGAVTVQARTETEAIDQDFQTVSVSIAGNVLHVVGAEDELLYIYNVTGVRVMSVKVDGNDKRYTLSLPRGCYIVKVGRVVRKISVR